MKKIDNQSCLWEVTLATRLTTTEKKTNRSWQSFFLMLVILLALFSAPCPRGMATSVTLEFETQGLNLKTGTVVKMLPRLTKETARADIIIAYNADVTPHAVLILRQPGIEMAIIEDVKFGQLMVNSIEKLNLTTKSIDQPLKQNNTVLLRTADGSKYKIGEVVESKSSVTFSYEPLQEGGQ